MKSKFEQPYKILGISQTATEDEIRAAYKKLSLIYHPDKHAGKSPEEIAQAASRFQEASEAYQMLSKKDKGFSKNFSYPTSFGDQGDMGLVIYEQEQLPFSSPLMLKGNTIENSYDSGVINMTPSKYQTISFGLTKWSPYNSEYLYSLDPEAVVKIITEAEKEYENAPNKVTEQAFLWEAKKEGSAPIYIFGTQHRGLSREKFKDIFGSAFDNIIDKVDVVFTEIDGDVSGDEMDKMIAYKAVERHKELRPLENMMVIGVATSNCMEVILNLPPATNLENDILQYLTHISSSSLLPDTNLERDILAELEKGLVANRNFFWLENNILKISEQRQQSSLVVCGSSHNTGQFGLPNLLVHKGYILTPLMKNAPIPKSTQIRSLFFNTQTQNPDEENKLQIIAKI